MVFRTDELPNYFFPSYGSAVELDSRWPTVIAGTKNESIFILYLFICPCIVRTLGKEVVRTGQMFGA